VLESGKKLRFSAKREFAVEKENAEKFGTQNNPSDML
jgi:hypothetical protein